MKEIVITPTPFYRTVSIVAIVLLGAMAIDSLIRYRETAWLSDTVLTIIFSLFFYALIILRLTYRKPTGMMILRTIMGTSTVRRAEIKQWGIVPIRSGGQIVTEKHLFQIDTVRGTIFFPRDGFFQIYPVKPERLDEMFAELSGKEPQQYPEVLVHEGIRHYGWRFLFI